MELTPIDIKQQKFTLRFRGFDISEVDMFLDEISSTMTSLINKNDQLRKELQNANLEIADYKEKESSLKKVMLNSQKALEQMKENAQKSAELMVSEAEVKAEKILNRAHNRLAQLHEDIAELKRQRMQIEIQIRSMLESHMKLLDMSTRKSEEADEDDAKIRVLAR